MIRDDSAILGKSKKLMSAPKHIDEVPAESSGSKPRLLAKYRPLRSWPLIAFEDGKCWKDMQRSCHTCGPSIIWALDASSAARRLLLQQTAQITTPDALQ